MPSDSSTADLQSLFEAQLNEGGLSSASLHALKVDDIGQQIQAGMGVNIDDVTSSEVVLLNILVDDSGSIQACGNTSLVRECVNSVLEALAVTRNPDAVLCHTRLLNGDVITPYCGIAAATPLDRNNYSESRFGGTPLYDQSIVMLATVLAKAQEFSDNGVPARTITLIVTDGEDAHSRKATAREVRTVVRDMLSQEIHIVAAFGIPGNSSVDFRRVFHEMGIEDRWILSPQAGKTMAETQKNIRAAFYLFSQSAVQASQSSAAFSKTAGGGFGG